MKFKELMSFPATEAGKIDIDELILNLPSTPIDVLEQFYQDHGRNEQFHEQYAELDIHNLKWELVNLTFNEISCATIFSSFQRWVDACYIKSRRVSTDLNWKLIGHTDQTVENWKYNHTWNRSPIFLELNCKLHLVEGHSRFGCLRGLVSEGLIPSNRTHKIWLAKIV
ncbi:hypothetical protein [Psychrobacter sp. NG27]|uniref:hypothetical protein n=1 Tax=Psychrobacter sp. NG27 TaxID=2781966 RepID=UPI0018DF9CFF|nr:hypothetical protein [Psychrobacter sp. NG27]MBI0425004.1 hypothetical protein [Psychrobacter sp. NG27]